MVAYVDGGHKHQSMVNSRAAAAAVYRTALCRAICKGHVREIEMARDKVRRFAVVGATGPIWENEYWTQAWDDVSGKFLDSRKIVAARRLEIEYRRGRGSAAPKQFKKDLRSSAQGGSTWARG